MENNVENLNAELTDEQLDPVAGGEAKVPVI